MDAPTDARAFYATSASSKIEAGVIKRRAIQPFDVSIKIHYCGICHTDLHMVRNDWGMCKYPLVPGHEIVGVVESVGTEVTKFKIGQRVGVGCIVDTCQTCDRCKVGHENHCTSYTMTYGTEDRVGKLGQTQGGYSERYVIHERYVLNIPDNIDFAAAAPLLCAGITVYSPLVEAGITAGKSVGVFGVGGLGHMAIKLGRALGAHVVAFTGKPEKKEELLGLGARFSCPYLQYSAIAPICCKAGICFYGIQLSVHLVLHSLTRARNARIWENESSLPCGVQLPPEPLYFTIPPILVERRVGMEWPGISDLIRGHK